MQQPQQRHSCPEDVTRNNSPFVSLQPPPTPQAHQQWPFSRTATCKEHRFGGPEPTRLAGRTKPLAPASRRDHAEANIGIARTQIRPSLARAAPVRLQPCRLPLRCCASSWPTKPVASASSTSVLAGGELGLPPGLDISGRQHPTYVTFACEGTPPRHHSVAGPLARRSGWRQLRRQDRERVWWHDTKATRLSIDDLFDVDGGAEGVVCSYLPLHQFHKEGYAAISTFDVRRGDALKQKSRWSKFSYKELNTYSYM
jgi:hypothetical protein